MRTKTVKVFRSSAWLGVAVAAALVCAQPAQARVTKIILGSPSPLAYNPAVPGAPAIDQISGQAFGELDPTDTHNSIITDITNAPTVLNAHGVPVVQYVATFVLTKPHDMTQASGFMWHDVPNRASSITIVGAERALGDVGLASAWQADNAGATSVQTVGTPGAVNTQHWVQVPMATNSNGTPITGNVLGRIVNRTGPASEPLNVMGNPIPYLPATLDTTQATLVTHTHETINGVISIGSTIPSTDWSFAHCTDWNHQTPQDINPAHLPPAPAATPPILPVHICLKNGFDPTLLYQVIYPAQNAWVLGVGIAAFRDVNSFFRYQTADDFGTANPLVVNGVNPIKWAVVRGVSQSGNFTRAFIHLGFNQDESNRIVHEGAWPIIAGRRVASGMRWGQPDGVLELYQTGSEGPQWWTDWPDTVRANPAGSLLDRCNKTTPNTCPKVFEHFGGSEVFALKMTMEWVGSSANADIPLPRTNRRYYVGSTTHGGGSGSYNIPATVTGVNCPGNNWGTGLYGANPVSEVDLVNVLRLAMRNWLMHGTNPPTSLYPTLSAGNLVDPTQAAMGFPSGVPGVPPSIFDPANFVNPVFDYNWGPNFNQVDQTGVPSNLPPSLTPVIAMKVPKVDADGNELGGIPNVMRDAPFATYLGWNVTSSVFGSLTTNFHAGQVCNYIGGMIPFANTQAQRVANGDPRPSLQERYGSHTGYVNAVIAAANNAACKGYLNAGPTAAGMGATCSQPSLPIGTTDDWAAEVNAATASNICAFGAAKQSCDPATP